MPPNPGARQGRPPKLGRRDVVDAAVALAEDKGLDAVTIRAVAARLGVAPMTLYGHVAGAEELIDLVVGATIAVAVERQSPLDVGVDGRTALLGFAHGLRAMLREHTAVLDAYRRRPVQDPTGLAITEHVVASLVASGVDEADAISAYATVFAYVIGWVSLESRPVDIERTALEGHPHLRGMSGRLADLFDRPTFERGLTALVDAAMPPASDDARTRPLRRKRP